MRIHRLAAVIAIPFMVAALALSSCGNDNNNNATGVGGRSGIGGFGGHAATGVGGAGGGNTDAGSNPDTVASAAEISIQHFTFSPGDLMVQPGATITVRNNDTVPHTVTSQSAPRAFVPGAVQGISFDTGIIPAGGTATITIPATAPHGTVIPYYCSVHTTAMANDGQVTVQ